MGTFFTMLVPIIIGAVALWGMVRKVDVYSALISGAEEGLGVLIRIVPALVGLLTAVYMLRASGALELAAEALAPLLHGFLSALFIGVLVRLVPLTAPVSNYLADQVAGIAGMEFHATLTASILAAWPIFLGFLLAAALGSRKCLGKRRKSVV